MKQIALILIIIQWFGCMEEKPSDYQIYQEFYAPYSKYTSFESKETTLKKQLNQGLDSYLKSDFESAFNQFSLILEIYMEHQITASFYSALSLMEMKNSSPEQKEIVESLFIDIIKHNRNPFTRQAEWYLALFYFKNFDGDKARPFLENLANSEGEFQSESQAILAKVK